jgi:hypothetical protein
MFLLLLIYVLAIVSGISVSSLLALPKCLLGWTIAVSAGCAQLIMSVQFLSLFRELSGDSFLLANIAVTAGLSSLALYRRRFRKPRWKTQSTLRFRQLLSEVGILNICFGVIVLVAFGVATFAAFVLFPATDAYHFNMCLFWKQNETIQAFAVHDPRIVCVVFASEALAFPGVLYAGSSIGFVALSTAAAVLLACLIYALSLGIGSSPRVAFVVSIVFSASMPLLSSILGAKSDFLFSTLWLIGSIYFLFETRSFADRRQALLACSVFLFAMACGAKNIIALQAPAYGLAILFLLGRKAFRPRLLLTAIFSGIAGLAASGLIWSYSQNQLWFGDWRGHSFVKATLAQNYDIHGIWTRLTRAFVTVACDSGWLPASLQPAYAHLTTGTIKALGGESTLPEDNEFFSFDTALIRPGSGMGPIGPVLVVPSLLTATVMLLRRVRLPDSDDTVRFRALTVFATLSLIVSYIALRTQWIGVTRLMLSCVAAAIPLSAIILRTRIGYWLGMGAAAASLLLSSVSALGLSLYRLNSQSFPMLTNLKRTPMETVQVRWNDNSAQNVTIREPYTSAELYSLVADRIRRADVVGLIGGYNAEAHFCFGSDHANYVVPLKDCRSDSIREPNPRIDCIVVEDFDVQSVDSNVLRGYRCIFQASRKGATRFAYFEREKRE